MKQDRLDKPHRDENQDDADIPNIRSVKYDSGRTFDINIHDFKMHPLWPILIETARNNPLFANRAGFAHNEIIPENPDISPKELASKLSITVGEALAILEGYELLAK